VIRFGGDLPVEPGVLVEVLRVDTEVGVVEADVALDPDQAPQHVS
jgi:hypothetical protein